MVNFSILIALAVVLYVIAALVNFFVLSKIITFDETLYLVFAIVIALPILAIKYIEDKRIKEMERSFPLFLQDFVETIRGGMTVPQAFKAISKNQYGRMTPLIKKMSAQLDWGIPIDVVLTNFGKETKSKIISRVVSTVMESHKYGGKLTDTFEALSKTALEIERLRAERRLLLNSQIITGYIIFLVFLGVIIGLQRVLVPSLGQVSAQTLAGLGGQVPADISQQYTEIFRNLILLQGLFAGLTIGKMSEGAIVAGIKHSIFMMGVGIFAFLIFV